ncbi:hypothetical protein D1007_10819 [Hordeum vulgare]|nr:hypothetical protein D1007_10819 [Hordeum vulgare]
MAGQRNRNRIRRQRAKARLDSEVEAEAEGAARVPEVDGEELRGTVDIRALRRRRLISRIRGHYLDAISRLPTTELNSTLARGLLIAGLCYGPLHPVHNIIVNSVCLSRADLRAAVASARGAAPSSFRLTASELEAAFQAADKAARHFKPAAFALFASSTVLSVERDAVSLLNNKRTLSSADILRLSTMLLPSPLPDELPHPPLEQERFTAAFKLITRKRNLLTGWYKRWVELADAALRKYARQTAAHYQLHVIYGIGSVHDEFSMDDSFHISFMARPKDPSCAREAPVFFFAEARLSGYDFCEEDITLCCTVEPSPSEVDRCHECVTGNFQIDHPDDSEKFSGGQYYTLDGTVKDLDCPIKSDADYRCFHPVRDIGLVEYLDQELTSYISSCPSRRRRFYRENIDEAILGYCSRIM